MGLSWRVLTLHRRLEQSVLASACWRRPQKELPRNVRSIPLRILMGVWRGKYFSPLHAHLHQVIWLGPMHLYTTIGIVHQCQFSSLLCAPWYPLMRCVHIWCLYLSSAILLSFRAVVEAHFLIPWQRQYSHNKLKIVQIRQYSLCQCFCAFIPVTVFGNQFW